MSTATVPVPHTASTSVVSTAVEPVVLRASASASVLRLVVLLVGPLVTLAGLSWVGAHSPFPDTFVLYGAWVAVALWSPLPVSFPALMLDHDRDMALVGKPWLVRAVALVPWMLVRSPARVEMAASLIGWAALVAAVCSS